MYKSLKNEKKQIIVLIFSLIITASKMLCELSSITVSPVQILAVCRYREFDLHVYICHMQEHPVQYDFGFYTVHANNMQPCE